MHVYLKTVFKPVSCLRKCLLRGGLTAVSNETHQLLRISAPLPRLSLLKFASLPLVSEASFRLAFYGWLRSYQCTPHVQSCKIVEESFRPSAQRRSLANIILPSNECSMLVHSGPIENFVA